jgi:hypothetical protein
MLVEKTKENLGPIQITQNALLKFGGSVLQ